MKKKSTQFLVLIGLFGYFLCASSIYASNSISVKHIEHNPRNILINQNLTGPADLPQKAQEKISQHLRKVEYEISECNKMLPSGRTAVHSAFNRKQNISAYFTDQGIGLLEIGKKAPDWYLEMTLSGYGYENNMTPVRQITTNNIKVSGHRIEYRRGGLTEWYVNDRRGIEQGATINERPSGKVSGPLVVQWRVSGSLVPKPASRGGSEITFCKRGDLPVIRYGGIRAWDVTGRSLPVKLTVGNRYSKNSSFLVSYVVDDTGAIYPVTIDPVFTLAQKILPLGFPSKFDHFGYSVSLDGDTVVVGANGDNDIFLDSGSVYIFDRNLGGTDNWGQVAKITAADPETDKGFGSSVSISGNTVVVGAPNDSDNGTESGSAYIFERNFGGTDNWGEVKKITADLGSEGDHFGRSVSISGNTVIVGAYGVDGAEIDYGAVYIFERYQGGPDNWGELKKIVASDAGAGHYFGYSVSIDGDTMVVGAYGYGSASGAAYIFDRDFGGTGNWGERKKITASDAAANSYFGLSVSVSGDTVIVGAYGDDELGNASGAAYIFERNAYTVANSWDQVQKIKAGDAAPYGYFGISVSVSGDSVVVGAYGDDDGNGKNSGSAYIFDRDPVVAENWSYVNKITGSDGRGDDIFARAVSISGDTVVSGASLDDDCGSESGSAYIFDRDKDGEDIWGQVAKITAGDGSAGGLVSDGSAYDNFGDCVSVSGDTMVVGASRDDDNGSGSGSVYIFYRNQGDADNWGQVQKITAGDSYPYDYFGYSLSISNDTMVVGAYGDDVDPTILDSGSAYIFERNQGGADNWGQVAKITASDAAADDYFGYSVSIDGNTVVVGAYQKSNNAGQAYVFERPLNGWTDMTETMKIIPDDGAEDDYFGHSVSISGDTILVGAYGDDGDGTISGSAYLFYRNEGGNDNWGQKKKLFPFSGGFSPNVYFGYSVSISGDTAVVGAYWDWENVIACGSAYVFERNAYMIPDIWAGQRVTPGNEDSSWFGYSVSISGDTILIGAIGDDENGSFSGSAYIFERDPEFYLNWSEVQKITAMDAAPADNFGNSVSISGGTLAIGAFKNDDNGSESGSAYIYKAIELCKGDFEPDGDVDGLDLTVFIEDFNRTNCETSPPCEGDFDGDGDVDEADLADFAGYFGKSDCT